MKFLKKYLASPRPFGVSKKCAVWMCSHQTAIISTSRRPAHPVSAPSIRPTEIQGLWSQNYDTRRPCNSQHDVVQRHACVLHIKPFFYPSTSSTASVRAYSSSYRDARSAVKTTTQDTNNANLSWVIYQNRKGKARPISYKYVAREKPNTTTAEPLCARFVLSESGRRYRYDLSLLQCYLIIGWYFSEKRNGWGFNKKKQ